MAVLFNGLIVGCSSVTSGTYSEFRSAPTRYTTFKVGDEYELQEDMLLLKYDYLIVPLVKPGIQLMPASAVKESELSEKFAVVGHARKGDVVKICGYENEGGWIPCQGDWYKVNPMVMALGGELKGQKVGISFLCDDHAEKLQFRTGKIFYAKPDEKLIRKKT